MKKQKKTQKFHRLGDKKVQVFFFVSKKKLLEQKRFEKIFQFIENFANFESKHPGIFENVTLSLFYFF